MYLFNINCINFKIDIFHECDNLTIYGYEGSCAEDFARNDEISFKSIDNELNNKNEFPGLNRKKIDIESKDNENKNTKTSYNELKYINSDKSLENLGYNLFDNINNARKQMKSNIKNDVDKFMYSKIINYTSKYTFFLELYNLNNICTNDNSRSIVVFF